MCLHVHLKILSCMGTVSTSGMCKFPWSEVTVDMMFVPVEMTRLYGSVRAKFTFQNHFGSWVPPSAVYCQDFHFRTGKLLTLC